MAIASALLIVSVFIMISALVSFMITIIDSNEGLVSLIIAIIGGIFLLLSGIFGMMGL